MPLTFESQLIDKFVVIRCKGRITLGEEVQALEGEVDRLTKVDGSNYYRAKHVVLQLAETDFLDSSGLGCLLRLYGVLRAAGGGLNLCRMQPKVLKVIEITNLGGVFPAYASEEEATAAFSGAGQGADRRFDSSKIRVVCIDTSKDVLAGLNALLTRAGYAVFTTRYIGEAVTLVKTTQPRIVVCGPGMMAVPNAGAIIDNFGQSGEKLDVVKLPSDFYTADAGQAGQDLLAQVQKLAAA